MALARNWHSPDVWSDPVEFDANIVRQLRVPASDFVLVSGDNQRQTVGNNYGLWPAAAVNRPLSDEKLWLRLPIGTGPGAEVPKASAWSRPADLGPELPSDVIKSYVGAISFEKGNQGQPGLRSPQLGAMHAALGYWTTKRADPATVVMPTGTGKTETMLGLLVAARPERLLVVVPSDALREQIAGKFERLGILQEIAVVKSSAKRPVVGRLCHGFSSVENALLFAGACNVVVTTPQALHSSDSDIVAVFLSCFSHLFVDEAHHVPAASWSRIRDQFDGQPVVQFTATPFREDGRHMQGTIIYSFPLREAQEQGYFSTIDFKSIVSLEDPDRALAVEALQRLRSDLNSGFDHILMARVRSIAKAKALSPLYEELAGDLGVVVMHHNLVVSRKRANFEALKNRAARIVVCVDMLGEGFDLPALKVAAVHEAHRSLGVTLQFIGRFTRTSNSETLGAASLFVVRNELEADSRLRYLYSEDADWNTLLRDVSESAVEKQRQISEFEGGFSSRPDEVALQSLLPKMSTVVYRTPMATWDPQAVVEFFGEENLLTYPIGLNAQAGVAWFVVESRTQVRWADIRTVEDVAFELYVLYFDAERRLLYVNNSANDGVFEDLVEAVTGTGAVRFTGTTVYRVMADVQRLVVLGRDVVDGLGVKGEDLRA